MTARAEEPFSKQGAFSGLVVLLVDLAIAAMPIFEPSRHVIEMLVRYAWVGAVSSIIYAVLVGIAVSSLELNHDLAAVISFVLVVPLNFVMHRGFTFRSLGGIHEDLPRYVMLQMTGIVVSVLIMSLSVDILGWPYPIGIAGSIFFVPLVSFLVMDRWVFARKTI